MLPHGADIWTSSRGPRTTSRGTARAPARVGGVVTAERRRRGSRRLVAWSRFLAASLTMRSARVIPWGGCGGFCDQLALPRARDGRQEGPRVPFVVVSAHAKPRFTDSSPTTSTGSILAFIEATFGLPALNVNDRQAYNLAGMF